IWSREMKLKVSGETGTIQVSLLGELSVKELQGSRNIFGLPPCKPSHLSNCLGIGPSDHTRQLTGFTVQPDQDIMKALCFIFYLFDVIVDEICGGIEDHVVISWI
ncbi:MAG: hypothetical protein QUV10_13865, partial [Paracoccaceae bacterium]|nr:hypothetical protein [Paracoccaceae bacterium]